MDFKMDLLGVGPRSCPIHIRNWDGAGPKCICTSFNITAAEKLDRRMPRVLQGKMKRHNEFCAPSHLVGASISSINSFRWGVFEPTNPSCSSAYTSLTNTHCFESFSLRWYRESCRDPHLTKIDKNRHNPCWVFVESCGGLGLGGKARSLPGSLMRSLQVRF